MFEEVWNQLEQEAVLWWKNTHFQQVKYAMNEGMLLEGAIQKIVKKGVQKQKLYKMKQNGILVNMVRP